MNIGITFFKSLICLIVNVFFVISVVNAQAPALTEKNLALTAQFKGDKQLVAAGFVEQTVSSGTTATVREDEYLEFVAGTSQFYVHRATASSTIKFDPQGDYTIEFRARVQGEGSWRGLDFSFNDGIGKAKNAFYLAHYRLGEVTDDPTMLDYRPNSSQFRVIRVAVQRNLKKAHFYSDGIFFKTKDLIDAVEGDTKYFQFGKGHSAAIHTIDIDYISIDETGAYAPESTTPVTLSTFDTEKTGSGVRLIWETLAEINNSYFLLEKSIDAELFEELTRVKAKGPSIYSVIDFSPYQGNNYYRLTQYDIDGVKHVYPVKVINFSMGAKGILVYPNPIQQSNELSILNLQKGKTKVRIYNGRGIRVFFDEVTIQNEEIYRLEINKNLVEGIYFLKTENGSNITTNKLLVTNSK